MDDPADVGRDTPVSDDYGRAGNKFTGDVKRVQIDIDDAAEDVDHLISPQERFRLAMAEQWPEPRGGALSICNTAATASHLTTR